MNISHLKCFIAVYETRSINKAARNLYMSAQGVGKNIQCLENELDTLLFERTKNGVFPTETGNLLYKKADVIIKQLEEVKLSIDQFNQKNKLLRIGYDCGIFNIIPFDLIQKFMDENPEIQVTWNEYSSVLVHEMLRESKLEYGFGIGLQRGYEKDDMVYRKISKKQAYLLVFEGHPLYGEKKVDVGSLKNEKILSLNENHYIYYHLKYLCEQNGFRANLIVRASDTGSLIYMCSQKIGLAVLPEYNCKNLSYDNVRKIPLTDDFCLDVHTTYKKENENVEVIRKFDEFLKKYI